MCKLPLISTNVGFASEFLIKESIYNNKDDGIQLVKDLINHPNKLRELSISNYNNTRSINNRSSAIKRLEEILKKK